MLRELLMEKSLEELQVIHDRTLRLLHMALDREMYDAVARKASDMSEIRSVMKEKLFLAN